MVDIFHRESSCIVVHSMMHIHSIHAFPDTQLFIEWTTKQKRKKIFENVIVQSMLKHTCLLLIC